MRVLIVDDDLQTISVVRDSIHWEAFQVDEVQIAYNGTSAQKKIQEFMPDLCICDIEMPKMSGIEVLKWARQMNYSTEFIFFTCHERFDFAATALQYDVISYVIKPFNIVKLNMAIQKAVDSIHKKKHEKENARIGNYWQKNKGILEEDFWRLLVLGEGLMNQEQIKREILRRHLEINDEGLRRIAVVSVMKSQLSTLDIDPKLLQYTLRKLCAEILLDELHFEHTFYEEESSYLRIITVMGDEKSVNQLKALGTRLIENVDKFFHIYAACYFTELVPLEQMTHIYQETQNYDKKNVTSRHHVFMPKDKWMQADDKNVEIDLEELGNLLRQGKQVEILNHVKYQLEALTRESKLTSEVMHGIHQDYLQILYSYLNKKGIQAHSLFRDEATRELSKFSEQSMFDMLKWMNVMTRRALEYVKKVEKPKTLTDVIKEYIDVHYREELKHQDLANLVYLTPDYMGKLFKGQEGISLKNYINKVRIEKAMMELEATEKTITEVAFSVGYENVSYFSTLFKKELGMTPNAYRQSVSLLKEE